MAAKPIQSDVFFSYRQLFPVRISYRQLFPVRISTSQTQLILGLLAIFLGTDQKKQLLF